MFIQTEALPGGSIMRFYPGRTVLEVGSAQFDGPDDAARSPLAAALFTIDGVEAVAFDADFVAVRKAEAADWQVLKPPILGAIMEHFVAGLPVIDDPALDIAGARDYGPDQPIVDAVQRALDERVRPGLAEEGGDVHFHGYTQGIARLSLAGGPFSAPLFAVKVKIENTLERLVPGLDGVEFVHEPPIDAAGWAEPEDRPGLRTPEAEAIQRLLDESVNPAVAAHGGYISLVDVQENRAYIRLEGGCQGCGMSTMTLRRGVEVEILRTVPTIAKVVDVTDHAAGTDPYYQPGAV